MARASLLSIALFIVPVGEMAVSAATRVDSPIEMSDRALTAVLDEHRRNGISESGPLRIVEYDKGASAVPSAATIENSSSNGVWMTVHLVHKTNEALSPEVSAYAVEYSDWL